MSQAHTPAHQSLEVTTTPPPTAADNLGEGTSDMDDADAQFKRFVETRKSIPVRAVVRRGKSQSNLGEDLKTLARQDYSADYSSDFTAGSKDRSQSFKDDAEASSNRGQARGSLQRPK
jgi:hypothetical protein